MPEKWRDRRTGIIVSFDISDDAPGYTGMTFADGTYTRMKHAAFDVFFTRIEEPVYVSGGCPADTPKGVTTIASAEPQDVPTGLLGGDPFQEHLAKYQKQLADFCRRVQDKTETAMRESLYELGWTPPLEHKRECVRWKRNQEHAKETKPVEPQEHKESVSPYTTLLRGNEGLKPCPPAKAYIVPADSTQIVLELNARIAELERERDQYKFDAGMSEARMHELEQQLSEETEAGKVRAAELQGRVHQLERQLAVSGDFLRRLEAALAASDALSEKRRVWIAYNMLGQDAICLSCYAVAPDSDEEHKNDCEAARLARKDGK
jgi:hypothetical protein